MEKAQMSLPLCEGNNRVKLTTSWTNENPGRRFESCAKLGRGRGCGHWNWFDPYMCDRSKEVIPGLLRSLNRKDQQIEELLESNADLWATNEELRGEIVSLEDRGAEFDKNHIFKEIEELQARVLELQINRDKETRLERDLVHMKVRSALVSVGIALLVLGYGWYLFGLI